jgi:predicted type IV restriction endonuclease
VADSGAQGTAAAAVPNLPKWEADARDRVKGGIKKFSKPLAEFLARDANEGDTRLLVTDFLCEALGFDKFADLTTEYMVKGEFADFGVRIDKQLVAFIEVKRIATKLNEHHLRQVEMYAVNEGVEWMMLTNGSHWQAYHMTPGMPVSIDLALDVDILGPEQPAKKVEALFHLTREALKRHLIDDLWKTKRATAPKAIAQILTSPAVVTEVRRELGRQGYRATDMEVGELVRAAIRGDCQ